MISYNPFWRDFCPQEAKIVTKQEIINMRKTKKLPAYTESFFVHSAYIILTSIPHDLQTRNGTININIYRVFSFFVIGCNIPAVYFIKTD